MTPTPLGSRVLLGSLLGLALAHLPNESQAIEARVVRLQLTPAQKQKLFPEWRQLAVKTTQGRIAILQKSQQCIAAAGSLEAMRSCQRQELQALMRQRQENREAMRLLLQRNGITLPQPAEEGGSRRAPLQPEGVPMI